MIQVCNNCGRSFESQTKRKFCSEKCRIDTLNKKLKLNKLKKVCPQCKKEFLSEQDLRFCSSECRKKAMENDRAGKPMSSIDEKLAYCKKIGITYAEYQRLETLNERD